MYKFLETKDALSDWKKIQSMSKSVKEKYKHIFVDILNNPRNLHTFGNPEQLKHTEVEMWSRVLTQKDRIVYGIEQGIYLVFEDITKGYFLHNDVTY
jgi:Txe/YoeB family toxin of toxin-antitoxin system